MKSILTVLLFCGLLIFSSFVRWPFGDVNDITVVVDDTIDIGADLKEGFNYIDLDTDTNILLTATSLRSSMEVGELLLIEATESGYDADTITYGTGITGLADPIPSGKTRIITFCYNGTTFQKVASTQID